eukprot:COSAG02_NODE_10886_length_1838_cov_1.170213_1_plen_29_part_10
MSGSKPQQQNTGSKDGGILEIEELLTARR